MNRLEGKTTLITGAASGMGASHARFFVAEGASVVVTDVNEDAGRALCRELGPAARFLRHDVTSAADWSAVVSDTEAAHGPIDVLVNNAAIAPIQAFDDITEADFRRVVDVNQLSVFLGMKAVVPSMQRAGGGSIVNISSIAGLVGAPMGLHYAATKFAVRGMTKSAAIALAERHIRVNSVHPGMIRTPLFEASGLEDALLPVVPMHRVGLPEEVSSLLVYLASDESRYCTGAEFVVDGGLTA